MSKPIGQGFLHGSQGSCKHLANLLLFYKNRRSHHPVRACVGWGSQKDEAQYKQPQFKIFFKHILNSALIFCNYKKTTTNKLTLKSGFVHVTQSLKCKRYRLFLFLLLFFHVNKNFVRYLCRFIFSE